MQEPSIALVFRQTTPLDQQALRGCLQSFVDDHFGPAWYLGCCVGTMDPIGDDWPLVFLDDADQAGALGYHNDPPGQAPPCGFVFCRTAERSGQAISVVASHELAEMLTDPACNRGALSPRGRWVGLEPCDPVETETFEVRGLPVSDFVYPSWYGQQPAGPFDHLGRCSQPWQILPGGYVPVWANGRWTQLFASQEGVARHRAKENRLRRTERRRRAHHCHDLATVDQGTKGIGLETAGVC